MTVTIQPTKFAELNEVLARLLAEVSAILGDTLAGAYVQGSFALGDGDEHSDCDFLFVLHEEPQIANSAQP